MQKKKKRKLYNTLRVLWVITAMAAIILLVVYYIKIDSMNTPQSHAAVSDLSPTPVQTEDIFPSAGPDLTAVPEATPTPEPTLTPTPSPSPTPTPTPEPVEETRVIDPDKPMIALTFDDGPSTAATRRIIAVLEEYNSRGTFFMVGYNINHLPDIVEEVYEGGHQIANHTSNHVDLSKASKEKQNSEVWGNNDKINAIVPVGDLMLRPPYGSVNETLKKTIGTPMICWSVDTLDWQSRNSDAVIEETLKAVKDGYIVLMHDLYESTAEAVEYLVPKLIEDGYQLVTVEELFEARGVTLEDGHVYRMCTPTPVPAQDSAE